METMEAPDATVFKVALLLRRKMSSHRGWSYPKWSLLHLVPDESGSIAPARQRTVRQDDGTEDHFWCGFPVSLTRANAETYWFNLCSVRPSLFVVCRQDLDGELVPVSVTLDQDASSRQAEAEGEVFAVPLPEPMVEWLERFVVTHFRPEPRRRRRKPLDKEDKRT